MLLDALIFLIAERKFDQFVENLTQFRLTQRNYTIHQNPGNALIRGDQNEIRNSR